MHIYPFHSISLTQSIWKERKGYESSLTMSNQDDKQVISEVEKIIIKRVVPTGTYLFTSFLVRGKEECIWRQTELHKKAVSSRSNVNNKFFDATQATQIPHVSQPFRRINTFPPIHTSYTWRGSSWESYGRSINFVRPTSSNALILTCMYL